MYSSRRCHQACQSILLLLLAVFLTAPEATAQPTKPKKLMATFDAAADKLVVSWEKANGANEYNILVKDSDGKTKAKGNTTSVSKKFPGSKFQVAEEYTVKVKSVSGGSASKFVSKKYIHELSRAPGKGPLQTENSSGRAGHYYLPPDFGKQPHPLMVAFHGQGGDGLSMVNAFAKLAKKHGFIIIAPSSNLLPDGTSAWQVGSLPNSFSSDYVHAQNCIAEVLAFENVTIDPNRILTVGYSAGGAVAPYYATNNNEFTHFAILHGGVIFGGLGGHITSAWLSTGSNDTLRPPLELQAYVVLLQGLGFNDAIFTEYNTDHALAQEELKGVVNWWLN